MKTRVLILLLLPLLYLMQSCDDPKTAHKYDNETTVDVMGLNFIGSAAEAGHTEIRAAKIAVKVSTNPRVLSFAKMMIHDHTLAGEKLDNLKTRELISGPFASTEAHQEMVDTLGKLSGTDFDKAYINWMVWSHEKAVSLFREGAENRDNAVQNYALQTLPTIKMHLDSAKNILASLK